MHNFNIVHLSVLPFNESVGENEGFSFFLWILKGVKMHFWWHDIEGKNNGIKIIFQKPYEFVNKLVIKKITLHLPGWLVWWNWRQEWWFFKNYNY